MQSEARKTKRATEKAIKETDILCVKRKGFIGSMYVNGVTLHLTNTHAVLSRAYTHNVFQVGSVNYSMLKYAYSLYIKKDRDETDEHNLEVCKSTIKSFTIQDYVGSSSSNIMFNIMIHDFHLAKLQKATETELAKITESIMDLIQNSDKIDAGEDIIEKLDQSDLESEEVENANNVDLNHVRAGHNMIDALEANMQAEEPK